MDKKESQKKRTGPKSACGELSKTGAGKNGQTILIVDDEIDIRESLEEYLEREGFAVLTAENGEAALNVHRENELNAVVTDIRMPGMDGLQLLKELKTGDPKIPVIMLTSYDHAIDSLRLRADDYVQKPNYGELAFRLREVLRKKAMEIEIEKLERERIEKESMISAMDILLDKLNFPLKYVFGYISLLSYRLKPEQRKQFDKTMESAEKRLDLISDFIAYKSLDAQSMEMSSFNYMNSLNTAIDEIKLELQKYRPDEISIIFKPHSKNSVKVFADNNEIVGIVRELIINACRWTKQGEICIQTLDKGDLIETVIADYGEGIEEKYRSSVFVPGHIAHAPNPDTTREKNIYSFGADGNALGLARAKKAAELMGGALWFESEFGKGSQFYFTVPKKRIDGGKEKTR